MQWCINVSINNSDRKLSLHVGKNNADKTIEILKSAKIPIKGMDIGKSHGRNYDAVS